MDIKIVLPLPALLLPTSANHKMNTLKKLWKEDGSKPRVLQMGEKFLNFVEVSEVVVINTSP